jgi:hypothetical protein
MVEQPAPESPLQGDPLPCNYNAIQQVSALSRDGAGLNSNGGFE